MSNIVENFVTVHGGKLTVEDIEQTLHGELLAEANFYKSRLEENGRIFFWTKNCPPITELASLAYKRKLAITFEFQSNENGEIGSTQLFCRQPFIRGESEESDEVKDYYRPGGLPRDLEEQPRAVKSAGG